MASTPYTATSTITETNGPNSVIGLNAADSVGFFGSAGVAKQTVSGLKGSNAALASLIAALVAYGIIIDTTGA